LAFKEGEEMNSKRLISILVFFAILTLFSSSVLAQELRETPPVGLKILDIIVIRPISASVACATTAFCVGTMPLAFVTGVGEQSARFLIEAPWRFTAGRYLGDFHHYKDGKPITIVEE
jgi:hypothetical protein